ncbi:hypothetical protein CLOP_g16830 [Closterium sp. NIES-67]|nr:hypothetical protein CLOP_g16830 [Closterium sp. NIES-67]
MSTRNEQELILGLGISRGSDVLISHSPLKGEFDDFLLEAAKKVPKYARWFSLSWDQVMLIFLVHKDTICTLAAHECLGRSQARYHLENLLDDFRAHERGGVLSFSAHQRLERKLQAVVSANKGVVPPRVVLYLYPGAPKKFLTKADQEPEYIRPEGKTRLQKELEEFDEDDDFVFSTEHKEAMAAAAAAAGAGREGGGGAGRRAGLPPLAGRGRKGGGAGGGGAVGGKGAPPVSVSQRFSRELWRLKNPTDAWHGAYPYLSEALTPSVPDPKQSKQKPKRGASALAVAAASAKAAKGRRLSSSSDPGLNDPPSPRFGWGGGGISDGSLWLSGLQGRMSPSLSMDFSQMGAPEGPGSVLQAGLNLMFDASIGITSEYAAMRSRSTWSVQLTRVSAESSNNWEVGFGELKRCAAGGGTVGIAIVGSKGEGSKGEGSKGERPSSRGGKGEGRSSKSSSAKEGREGGSSSSSSTRKSGAMTGIVTRKKDGTHSVMIARGGSGSAVDLKSRKDDVAGTKGGAAGGAQEGGAAAGAEPLKEGEAGKEGGERKGREKIKGHIQARAPSGLSWEDEIASQLAAVGVRVAPSKSAKDSSSSDDDDDDRKSKDGRRSGIDQSPRAASAVYASQAARKPKGPTTSVFERKRPEYTRSPSDLHGEHGRAGSTGGSIGRSSGLAGLGRLARGLKKTFNIQGDQHAS